MIRCISILFMLAGCSSVWAFDEIKNNPKAVLAYQVAIGKAEQNRQLLELGRTISFTETVEEKKGAKVTNQKTIFLDDDGKEVKGPFNSNKGTSSLDWDYNILVNPSIFPDAASLIEETDRTWVFEIPTKISASTDQSDSSAEVNDANNKIVKALTTELVISKEEPRLLSQKIYARLPFKPQSMVKVDSFNIRIEYAMAWDNGPWITKSISKSLSGKYALFVNIEEFTLIRNEQFHWTNES